MTLKIHIAILIVTGFCLIHQGFSADTIPTEAQAAKEGQGTTSPKITGGELPSQSILKQAAADQVATVQSHAPQLLWPEGAPGAVGNDALDKPTLTLFLPTAERANGAAMIICPGGGYGHLAEVHEGRDVAAWLNSHGVTAFMLKYRLAPRYRHPAPLLDAQRAIRLVRSRAAELKLDPQRIGIMGFSAGGHLASTAATHFDQGNSAASDPIEQLGCRPDLLILGYPVISLTAACAHAGSRNNLLGKNPDPQLLELLSNEKQITQQTPPTFLFHTSADTAVPPENSLLFYSALHANQVPVEMHIYEKGKHGLGLAPKDPVLSTWSERCAAWMEARGFYKPATTK